MILRNRNKQEERKPSRLVESTSLLVRVYVNVRFADRSRILVQ